MRRTTRDVHLDHARRLRDGRTDAERKPWRFLRDRRPGALKFRRQHALGAYIVDFVCLERRVVVELDGSQHADPEAIAYDEARTRWLAADGFHVARPWNSDLSSDPAGAWATIRAAPHREDPLAS